MVSLRFKLMLQ
jgi:hypothetical protein